jgi:hypothetical protein
MLIKYASVFFLLLKIEMQYWNIFHNKCAWQDYKGSLGLGKFEIYP